MGGTGEEPELVSPDVGPPGEPGSPFLLAEVHALAAYPHEAPGRRRTRLSVDVGFARHRGCHVLIIRSSYA